MISKMMFVAHEGSQLGNEGPDGNWVKVGLFARDSALPIAFSETGDAAAEEIGYRACWESVRDMDDLQDLLRIGPLPEGPGIYIVEARFDQDEVCDEDGQQWEHLADAHAYRATADDLRDAHDGFGGWKWA